MRLMKLDVNALEVSTFEPATPVSFTPAAAAGTFGATCTRAEQSCVWACLPTEAIGCTLHGEMTCDCA